MVVDSPDLLQSVAGWTTSIGPLAALTVLSHRMSRRGYWLVVPWALLLTFDVYWASGLLAAGAPAGQALLVPIHQAAQAALIAGVLILMLVGVKSATRQEGLA